MPLPTAKFARELEVASELAEMAGQMVVKFRDETELGVEMKAGNEPVTIADRQASEMIVTRLQKEFPQDVIISEENTDDDERRLGHRVWFIDPIDGTKDYIRGEDGYSVMIGLALAGRPTLGVVYAPASKRTFAGVVGQGAWMTTPANRQPSSIQVSSRTDIETALLVASRSHRNDSLDRVKSALGIKNEHNVGSVGLKISLIALGERDLYVNPTSRCSTWDTCAPEALLISAGGSLSDIDGKPLVYTGPTNELLRGILASNQHLHQIAVDRVSPLFKTFDG